MAVEARGWYDAGAAAGLTVYLLQATLDWEAVDDGFVAKVRQACAVLSCTFLVRVLSLPIDV